MKTLYQFLSMCQTGSESIVPTMTNRIFPERLRAPPIHCAYRHGMLPLIAKSVFRRAKGFSLS